MRITRQVLYALLAPAVVTAFGLAEPAFAQETATAPASRPTAASGPSEEVRLSAGRPDEYDGMIADLGLTGDELARFKAKDAERLAALVAFIHSDDGQKLVALREQLAAARREGRKADAQAIRVQLEPLTDKYWAVRNAGRRALMSTLNESQLKRVAGGSLQVRTNGFFEGAKLTDEQKAKARAICDEIAGEWFKMSMLETDPYLRELGSIVQVARKRITLEVLTDEQRAALKHRPPQEAK